MEVKGICNICGNVGILHTCRLCGRLVCGECYIPAAGLCRICYKKPGRRIKNINDKDMLINLFKEKNVVKFGNFTLSSGKKSNYYINVKGAITYPKILKILTNIIVKKIKDLDIQKIAGPAVGAIPIITAVSLKANIPFVIIRKKKKKYGTSKLVEGDLSKNDKVVVIEDVTTTGNSLLRSIRIIEDAGAKVERAIVVVDRGEGAIEKFKKEGIKLDVILTADELMD